MYCTKRSSILVPTLPTFTLQSSRWQLSGAEALVTPTAHKLHRRWAPMLSSIGPQCQSGRAGVWTTNLISNPNFNSLSYHCLTLCSIEEMQPRGHLNLKPWPGFEQATFQPRPNAQPIEPQDLRYLLYIRWNWFEVSVKAVAGNSLNLEHLEVYVNKCKSIWLKNWPTKDWLHSA